MRAKLLTVLLVPCAALAWFAGGTVRASWRTAREVQAVQELATFSVRASELVHEVQKERAVTVGYVGSRGAKFAAEVPSQRRQTDARRAPYAEAVRRLDAARFGPGFVAAVRGATAKLDSLDATRAAADNFGAPPPRFIAYFSTTVDALLGISDRLGPVTADTAVATRANAYATLATAKERVGRERAVLNAAFTAHKFDAEGFATFAGLLAEQKLLFDRFRTLATPAMRALLDEKLRAPVVAEAERMRAPALAAADGRPLDVDPVAFHNANAEESAAAAATLADNAARLRDLTGQFTLADATEALGALASRRAA